MFESIFNYIFSLNFDCFVDGTDFASFLGYLVGILAVSIVCFLPFAILIKVIRRFGNG